MSGWFIAALAQIASLFDPVDADPQLALVAHLQYYGSLCAQVGYAYDEVKSPTLDREFAGARPDLETAPGAVATRMGRALMQLRLQGQYDAFTPAPMDPKMSDEALAEAAAKTLEKPKAVCAALAEDRFTSRYVRRLPEAEFLKAQTEFDDQFLRLFGRASWQTKEAAAAMNLAFGAGLCAVVLPGSEVADALAAAERSARNEQRPEEALKLVRDSYESGERRADRDWLLSGCRSTIAAAKAKVALHGSR